MDEYILSLIIDSDGEENVICMLSLVNLKDEIYWNEHEMWKETDAGANYSKKME